MKRYVRHYTKRKQEGGWGLTLALALAVLMVTALYVAKALPSREQEQTEEALPSCTPAEEQTLGTAEITETVAFPEITVYCLATGKYDTEEEAEAEAEAQREMGQAGLVVPNDAGYSVLLTAYTDREECDAAAQAQTGETVLLRIPAMEMKLTASPQRIDGIRDAYAVWQQTMQLFGDLWQDLDNGTCDTQQALCRLNTQQEKLQEAEDKAFSDALITGETTALDGLDAVLTDCSLQMSKLLLESAPKPLEVSAGIKYNLLMSLMEAKTCIEEMQE